MFTKPASFKPFAAIKGSERKSLSARIEREFSVELDASQKSLLIPKTLQSAKAVLHAGAKIQVYSTDEVALWIVVRDHLVPTVAALSVCPTLLPVVSTVPNTLQFLQNGADFMAPGIFGNTPPVPKGHLVQVRTLTEPYNVLAVGFAMVDLTIPPEKGKAIEIVNVIGDTLLPSMPKTYSTVVPENQAQFGQNSDRTSANSQSDEPATNSTPDQLEISEIETRTVGDLNTATTNESGLQEVAARDSEEDGEPDIDRLSLSETDEAFEYALKRAFAAKHDYPMPAATAAPLITASLPFEHPDLAMKNTTWKKVPKFLKWAAKRGYIDVKERQGGEVVVIRTNLAGLEPEVPKRKVVKAKQAKIGAQLVYSPRKSAKALGVQDGWYKASELRSKLEHYISEQKLADESEVKVDPLLRTALGLKQNIDSVKRAEAASRFLDHANAIHHILVIDGEPSKPLKGPIPHVVLASERRGGHKTVTVVVGAEKFGYDLKKLAERLRTACAGSATVSTDRAGIEHVVIQGDHTAKIRQLLENDGLQSSWVIKK